MEYIAPTIERMRKGDRIEAPVFDQTSRRAYHRTIHKFEDLYQNGKINEACFQAGQKLMRHYLGSLGHDVRSGELGTIVDGDPNLIDFPLHYHGEKLKKAKEYVRNADRWGAVIAMVEESRSIQEIGSDWMGSKDKARAYIAGLALIRMGLDDLSVHWKLRQNFHDQPPNR